MSEQIPFDPERSEGGGVEGALDSRAEEAEQATRDLDLQDEQADDVTGGARKAGKDQQEYL